MELTIAPRGILQINDARIIFRNFRGEGSAYNHEGDRDFSLVIPNEEMAEMLTREGWNVKIKPPREEGDTPLMYLKIKVKFNDRGPHIYLQTGQNRNKLSEENVACLDNVDISSVDMDIRPYDWGPVGPEKKYGRSAYLQSLLVRQEISDRFAEEEYPEE